MGLGMGLGLGRPPCEKKTVFVFLFPPPSPTHRFGDLYRRRLFRFSVFVFSPKCRFFFLSEMTSLPALDYIPPISTLTKPQTKTRYSIYAAIITIVTNHYRPQRDARELDARKKLTRSLRFLIPSTVHFQ